MFLPSLIKRPHLRGGPESRPKLALLARLKTHLIRVVSLMTCLLCVPVPPPCESCESLGSHWLWCEWTVAVRANIYDGSMNDDHFKTACLSFCTKYKRSVEVSHVTADERWQIVGVRHQYNIAHRSVINTLLIQKGFSSVYKLYGEPTVGKYLDISAAW